MECMHGNMKRRMYRNVAALHFANMEGVNRHAKNVTVLRNLRARKTEGSDVGNVGGKAFCEHGKVKIICKDCGGSQICKHGKYKDSCRDCGGSGICEHG